MFGNPQKTVIGMVHLAPLLTFQDHPGLKVMLERATCDFNALQTAWFDAVLIENDDDKPSTEFANSAQIANFSIIAHEIAKIAKIPIGVQVMLNDWKASIDIAKLVGATFIRIDVFVDDVYSENWDLEIKPDPKQIMDYKNSVYPELIILTDIQVKHKTMLDKKKTLTQSAKEAIDAGSDGLIISGRATGEETPIEKIIEIKTTCPNFPVWVGAGINEKNIGEQLKIVDGIIVGTSIKTGDKIDLNKAKNLINLVK